MFFTVHSAYMYVQEWVCVSNRHKSKFHVHLHSMRLHILQKMLRPYIMQCKRM